MFKVCGLWIAGRLCFDSVHFELRVRQALSPGIRSGDVHPEANENFGDGKDENLGRTWNILEHIGTYWNMCQLHGFPFQNVAAAQLPGRMGGSHGMRYSN